MQALIPLIVFALARESLPFRRQFVSCQRIIKSPPRAWHCSSHDLNVLVLETGIGSERAARALQSLLVSDAHPQPSMIVSAGFSGALDISCAVGDVILANEVADTEGNIWNTNWPSEPRQGPSRSRILTTPRLIGTRAEKEELGRQYRAVAVDMESAAVARFCAEHGIPFGAIRAISDDARTSLSPQLLCLLKEARISVFRSLSALIRKPTLAGEMWRLAKNTQLAAERLAENLFELLQDQ